MRTAEIQLLLNMVSCLVVYCVQLCCGMLPKSKYVNRFSACYDFCLSQSIPVMDFPVLVL